ncbi:MAG TPA: hypothetical protein ENI77_07015, partial [Nitrospirae bacterium]|nr:hypothetical protein [Nitrospirota bacterium]
QRIVKILDFGLAKAMQADGGGTMDTELTQQGRVLGTPAYMSPEQAKGETAKIGPPSDIYSMGVIFYHMLSGKLPFQSDTPWGVMHKHISETPSPLREVAPSVPENVEKVIMRCLAKEPEERYKSALDVKRAFAGKQAGDSAGFDQFEGTIADATIMDAPVAPEKKGSKAGVVVALMFLVLAGAGYFGWLFYKKPVDDKQTATAPKETAPPPKPKAVSKPVTLAGPTAMFRGGAARSMGVKQVNMTDKKQLQDCVYLGLVKGWSWKGGWLGREAGEKNSMNSALKKASKLGATHVLWTKKTHNFGTGVKGKTYKCK